MNFILEESSFSQVREYDALYIMKLLSNSNFTNNNNLPLHVDNSSTEVHHSTFVNNNRGRRYPGGGALLVHNAQHIVTIISHCSFINNSAYYGGGAVFTKNSLVIQHSSFTNNQVSSGECGGAIYTY